MASSMTVKHNFERLQFHREAACSAINDAVKCCDRLVAFAESIERDADLASLITASEKRAITRLAERYRHISERQRDVKQSIEKART